MRRGQDLEPIASPDTSPGLNGPIRRAWRALEDASASDASHVLVVPSIPVAWFGDLDAYLASPIRVVTVGLNPSNAEFPRTDPFARFPKARDLGGSVASTGDHARYVGALNDYFRADPYSAWFRPAFEELLLGMDASYYGSRASTALHTDLFSPLATDPTWSQLGPERGVLARQGVDLWHELIAFLRPDVMIASVARRYLDEIRFEWSGQWRTLHTIERENPYVVDARDLQISPDKQSTLVFGRAANLPFGTVSTVDKHRIGVAIGEDLRAR